MSELPQKLVDRMDVLAKEVEDLQQRLLHLNAELGSAGHRHLLSRGILASYHLDRAGDELARRPGSGSGGSTGPHSPPPIQGGGLKPV